MSSWVLLFFLGQKFVSLSIRKQQKNPWLEYLFCPTGSSVSQQKVKFLFLIERMICFELLIPQGNHGSLLKNEHIFKSVLGQVLERVTLLEICVDAEMTQPHGWNEN